MNTHDAPAAPAHLDMAHVWRRYVEAYRTYDATKNAWEDDGSHTPEERRLLREMEQLEDQFDGMAPSTPAEFALKLRRLLQRGICRDYMVDWIIYGKPMRLDVEQGKLERLGIFYGEEFEIARLALALLKQCEGKVAP